ncbi:PspC domain-containing protein [Marinitoga aeolica]|uniref:PspC domain-containing protein n=1 Tax=Marinitoga aeolica TaxID=2809031 RepID=A0ABY8PR84_9BACT|nr:PspC domain-containing protein [Marinitoga aeolica]WGS65135.1 PspC domain-containing protein [Marinitoga aeolica]
MKKELYRSRKDKFLGGVCGGLAEYFEISSTLVRLICLGLILIDGIGILLYIIAWIIIPEEPAISDENVYESEKNFNKHKYSERNNLFIGLTFLILGIIFILNNFFPHIVSFSVIFGILFLVFGIYLIIRGKK